MAKPVEKTDKFIGKDELSRATNRSVSLKAKAAEAAGELSEFFKSMEEKHNLSRPVFKIFLRFKLERDAAKRARMFREFQHLVKISALEKEIQRDLFEHEKEMKAEAKAEAKQVAKTAKAQGRKPRKSKQKDIEEAIAEAAPATEETNVTELHPAA